MQKPKSNRNDPDAGIKSPFAPRLKAEKKNGFYFVLGMLCQLGVRVIAQSGVCPLYADAWRCCSFTTWRDTHTHARAGTHTLYEEGGVGNRDVQSLFSASPQFVGNKFIPGCYIQRNIKNKNKGSGCMWGAEVHLRVCAEDRKKMQDLLLQYYYFLLCLGRYLFKVCCF